MSRPLRAWIAFGLSLLVVLAAMGWISSAVLRLDRLERTALAQAEVEENARLALWRMDSALTGLIVRESSRPASFYEPSGFGKGKTAAPASHVVLYFQLDSRGPAAFPSPLPDPGSRIPARALRESFPDDGTNESQTVQALLANAAPAEGEQVQPQDWQIQDQQPPSQQAQRGQPRQQAMNYREFQARAGNVGLLNSAVEDLEQLTPSPGGLPGSFMRAAWIGNDLYLARWASRGKERVLQGVCLDWPGLKAWLLGLVKDLLPAADLVPAGSPPGSPELRRLAALPAVLLPGEPIPVPGWAWSPLQVSLLVAWGCILLGTGAVAALLAGVISLSERRAAFVSAVTHELRTPLTTFRLYTEMLAGGMVPEEAKKKEYLGTLAREAGRLGHLVGNVLAYARLEKGRPGGHVEVLDAEEILARSAQHLRERAEQAGMQLDLEPGSAPGSFGVRADASAVEQILFNLVDNACKYAGKAADRRIEVRLRRSGRFAEILVRDHGPGVAEPRRLFRPFSKSAREAANSAPGVGLGLALSRRLARAMGGDLRLDRAVRDGACFILRLRAA